MIQHEKKKKTVKILKLDADVNQSRNLFLALADEGDFPECCLPDLFYQLISGKLLITYFSS